MDTNAKSAIESSTSEIASPKVGSQEHSLQYEYDTLIEEYRIATDRIARRLEADERGFEITLVGVSLVVTASAIVVEQKVYALLLVLAIPFHILIWAQLLRAVLSYHLGKYIRENLAPRLDTIIQRTSTSSEKYGETFRFVSWEGYSRSMNKHNPAIGSIPFLANAGRIFLQLSGAVILLIAYIFLRFGDGQYIVSAFDTGLLVVNAVISLVSLIYIAVVYNYLRA